MAMLWWRKPETRTPKPETRNLTSRERVRRTLQRKPVDKVPCVDVYFLPETLKQWEREGYPPDASPAEFFDLDLVCLPVDCTMGWQQEVVEETEEYLIVTEADGVTRKRWKVYSAQPQELDFPVKQARHWREIRPALKPHEGRLPENLEQQIALARKQERFVALAFVEPCTLARRLLGSHQWVEALQTTPPMLDEMLETGVRLVTETVDLALKRLSSLTPHPSSSIDGIWLHADLAYTHGAFMTDKDYNRLVLPYHRQLGQELKRRGLTVLFYTPGKVETFLKVIRKSGFDAVLPLETFSQNDLATYKRAYGSHVALGGNISADRLMEGDEAAEQEVRQKVTVGMGETFSGYLFCLDRPVPPMLLLHRYQRALALARSLSSLTG